MTCSQDRLWKQLMAYTKTIWLYFILCNRNRLFISAYDISCKLSCLSKQGLNLFFLLFDSLLRLERKSDWWNFWGKDLWIVVGRMKWKLSAGFYFILLLIVFWFSIVLRHLEENNLWFQVYLLYYRFKSLMDIHYRCKSVLHLHWKGDLHFSVSYINFKTIQYCQSVLEENSGWLKFWYAIVL